MAKNIEELAQYFDGKLSQINALLDLRGLAEGPSDRTKDVEILRSINKEVTEIEKSLKDYKEYLASQKKSVARAKDLIGVVAVYQKRIDQITANIPEHCPRPGQASAVAAAPTPRRNVLKEKPDTQGSERTSKKKPKSAVSTNCPRIAYLTVEEFDKVPSYLKGRISYARVNSAIDEIQKVLDAKHKILNTPRSAMSRTVMIKYTEFKEQESDDTKGQFFFVDKNLSEYSSYRLDKTGQTIMCILRHCARIRQVRGGKWVRYVLKDGPL